MSLYEPYYLRDNPFPATPLLDPSSNDDRVNGKIYNPHIRETEIHSFESKMSQRPPLIYIENLEFERGVGKSALLVQQWRQLQKQAEVTSIYIRSTEKFRPVDFAARLIERWHQEGHLWAVVLQVLATYVKDDSQSGMSLAGFSLFKQKLPELPTRPFSLTHFNVFNPKRLINDLTNLAHRQAGDHLHIDLARAFFEAYLTDPNQFLQTYPAAGMCQALWDNSDEKLVSSGCVQLGCSTAFPAVARYSAASGDRCASPSGTLDPACAPGSARSGGGTAIG